jgi:hypothetical protein
VTRPHRLGLVVVPGRHLGRRAVVAERKGIVRHVRGQAREFLRRHDDPPCDARAAASDLL